MGTNDSALPKETVGQAAFNDLIHLGSLSQHHQREANRLVDLVRHCSGGGNTAPHFITWNQVHYKHPSLQGFLEESTGDAFTHLA